MSGEKDPIQGKYLDEYLATLDSWLERPLIAEPPEAMQRQIGDLAFFRYVRETLRKHEDCRDTGLSFDFLEHLINSYSAKSAITELLRDAARQLAAGRAFKPDMAKIQDAESHTDREEAVRFLFFELQEIRDGKKDTVEFCQEMIDDPKRNNHHIPSSARHYLFRLRDIQEQEARGATMRLAYCKEILALDGRLLEQDLITGQPGLEGSPARLAYAKEECLREVAGETGISYGRGGPSMG